LHLLTIALRLTQCRKEENANVEKPVVDEEGKLTIPSHVLKKRGLHPGDELMLIEAAEGLLIYHRGVDPATARWWDKLSEQERQQAQAEARAYDNLSEEEKDAIWDDGIESNKRTQKI